MKSYGHLWEKFIDEENIRKSILNASLRKRKRRDVMKVLENIDDYIIKINHYAENFYNCKHNPIEIIDGSSGKRREIIVPKFKEQIIHHMIVNTMMPIFTKGLYKHTYASIPKRGLHGGRKCVEKWIKYDKRNVKYCLKLDIKKFFNSIDHDILKARFAKIIKDKKFLNILFTIIDVGDNGLPLGFFTSQWFANWLLQPLDHFIKEKLKVPHYIRYMDDMVLFSSNKRKLHQANKQIQEYLKKTLNLKIKNNWQLFRFDYIKKNKHYGRALDFMGFKFYRDRVILRRNIMLRMSKKARKIYKKRNLTIYDARQIMSYIGWLNTTDTYYVYSQYIAPYLNFDDCKIKISKYDRYLHKHSLI